MKIKIHYSIAIIASVLIFLLSSCIGQTKTTPTSSPEFPHTIFSTFTITSTNTPLPIPTVTSTISPTPDVCNPALWQEDSIYVLSTDQFSGLRPGGPNIFNRILIAQNSAWADFRQEDHDELRSAGVIFHEASFGPKMGMGANPAIVLVTYGVEYDWELPKYGDLVSRVEQIRDSLYQHESEWFLGEVDQSLYPPIANGATYALFRFFDGNKNLLETWCRTYLEIYGEPPLKVTPSPSPTCEVEFGYDYSESVAVEGGCLVTILPGTHKDIGYSLIHPENWDVSLVGANSYNLSFNHNSQSGSTQELFLQVISTRLTLEDADQADAGDEIIGARPLVLPEETILDREIIFLYYVQPVLQLDTSVEDIRISRYFIIKDIPLPKESSSSLSMLFMFRASATTETYDTDEYQDFLHQVEEMALSLKVLQ